VSRWFGEEEDWEPKCCFDAGGGVEVPLEKRVSWRLLRSIYRFSDTEPLGMKNMGEKGADSKEMMVGNFALCLVVYTRCPKWAPAFGAHL
jgi:hypothetical protein